MNNREVDRTILVISIDFLLFCFCWVLMHYIAEKTLTLTAAYIRLLFLSGFVWFFLSFWFKKFNLRNYDDWIWVIRTILKSAIAMIYFVSLAVVIRYAPGISKHHVFGTFVLLACLEILLFLLFSRNFRPDLIVPKKIVLARPKVFFGLAVVDFFILLGCFYLVNALHAHTWRIDDKDWMLFIFMVGAWLLSIALTTKFEERHYRNIYHAVWPSMVAPVLMAGAMSVLVFALNLFQFSRTLIFGTILTWGTASGLLSLLYFISRDRSEEIEDVDSLRQVMTALKQEELHLPAQGDRIHNGDCCRMLAEGPLKHLPELSQFLKNTLEPHDLAAAECLVLDTHTSFNIEIQKDASLQLFINLHRVNDFRQMNKYFLSVHAKLRNGGFFVGCKEPVERVRQRFVKKYPEFLAMILYTIHFIFFRIWPKLPVFKKVYFLLSRGRNPIMSRGELYGRLGFCGYQIVAAKTLYDNHYFIARKVKTPSADQDPSYGPLIKIKKIGYEGKVIQLYKLRTMHAYSEYIQDYVFEKNKLHSSGKFQDDFRVTSWGKVLRALWIDELPQLYNLIRGDVTLVGVRALSGQYFSLYPKDMQKLRVQFKPGLIPPFYADMPKSFDEIVESERRYLLKKKERPFRTDMEYLAKAFYNIVLRGARSK